MSEGLQKRFLVEFTDPEEDGKLMSIILHGKNAQAAVNFVRTKKPLVTVTAVYVASQEWA